MNDEKLIKELKWKMSQIRKLAKSKSMSPYELCNSIVEITTEALNDIKVNKE